MFGLLVKNVYLKDEAARAVAIKDTLTNALPQHLTFLEKLVGENGQFSTGQRLLVGDVLIICALNIAQDVHGECLATFPKLAAFYAKHHGDVLGDLAKVEPFIKYKITEGK